MRPPSAHTIRLVVASSVLLTAFHFADNFVSIETYPQPGWISAAIVAAAWPILTAFGIAGYLLYRRGRFTAAHACLIAYSYTGISSLGHFLSGSPDEFTTRGLVSILLDGTIGFTILAITIHSILAHRAQPATRVG